MNKEIYAQEDIVVEGYSVFLAGPTPRESSTPSWRPNMIKTIREKGFQGDILIPEKRGNYLDYEYVVQTKWEVKYLNIASKILFWIPREIDKMPGFTTNIEFGEFMHSGKIVLGYPEGAAKMRYLQVRAEMHDIPVRRTMDEIANFIIADWKSKHKVALQ